MLDTSVDQGYCGTLRFNGAELGPREVGNRSFAFRGKWEFDGKLSNEREVRAKAHRIAFDALEKQFPWGDETLNAVRAYRDQRFWGHTLFNLVGDHVEVAISLLEDQYELERRRLCRSVGSSAETDQLKMIIYANVLAVQTSLWSKIETLLDYTYMKEAVQQTALGHVIRREDSSRRYGDPSIYTLTFRRIRAAQQLADPGDPKLLESVAQGIRDAGIPDAQNRYRSWLPKPEQSA